MAELLPTVGVCSYGGVVFGVKCETTEFSGTPKYDAARRSIAYVVFSIKLKTIIYNDSGTTDAQIDAALNTLMTPGLAFVYTGKGAGNFTINTGGLSDVAWGPLPKVYMWKPVGGNRAVQVEWGVEVAIPTCTAAFSRFQVMEFNYRVNRTYNQSGRCTRTISGYLTIPMTRIAAGNRNLPDSADHYLDQIVSAPLDGFRRKPPDTVLDESKSRLDFTITDEELPAPLQQGVIECRASHRFRSSGINLDRMYGTIAASYVLSPDLPAGRAWELFLQLVNERLGYISNGRPVGGMTGGRPAVIVSGLEIGEPDIFGEDPAEFSLSYQILTDFKSSFLAASGLWRQVTSANDSLWAMSLAGTAFANRGGSNAQFNLSGDAVVDLCQVTQGSPVVTSGSATRRPYTLNQTSLSTQKPTALTSWLGYRCNITSGIEDRTIEHKPLSPSIRFQNPVAILPLVDGQGSLPFNAVAFSGVASDISPYNPAAFYNGYNPTGVFQSQGVPSIEIIVEGSALRAGYLIRQPQLVAVSGVSVIPQNRFGREYFRSWLAANYNYPVIAAEWRLRYLMLSTPSLGVGVVPSPMV